MADTKTWRDKPREEGKAAYREGKDRDANPYPAYSSDRLEWIEGWVWCMSHYTRRPRASRRSERGRLFGAGSVGPTNTTLARNS